MAGVKKFGVSLTASFWDICILWLWIATWDIPPLPLLSSVTPTQVTGKELFWVLSRVSRVIKELCSLWDICMRAGRWEKAAPIWSGRTRNSLLKGIWHCRQFYSAGPTSAILVLVNACMLFLGGAFLLRISSLHFLTCALRFQVCLRGCRSALLRSRAKQKYRLEFCRFKRDSETQLGSLWPFHRQQHSTLYHSFLKYRILLISWKIRRPIFLCRCCKVHTLLAELSMANSFSEWFLLRGKHLKMWPWLSEPLGNFCHFDKCLPSNGL